MATVESLRELEQEEHDLIAERERNDQRRASGREQEERRVSVERLNQYLAETITRAHRALQLQLDQREATAWLRHLRVLNRDFANASAVRLISYWLWFLTTPAAYALDCLLFAPNARHLAQGAFPGWPIVIFVMSFIIPLVLLLLENVISHRLTDARLHAGSEISSFFIWAAAIAATIVMPALIAVTQLAAQAASLSPRLLLMHRFQMLAMVLIALLSHGLVVFSGQKGQQAKAFVFFKLQEFIRRWRSRNLERVYRVERRAMADSYTSYRQGLDAHNAEHPDAPIEHGQVDRTTAEQVNDWFGYRVIILDGQRGGDQAQGFNLQPDDIEPHPPAEANRVANQPPSTPQGAHATATAQTPTGQDEAVEDYYQSLLSYRRSEEDSEVRV